MATNVRSTKGIKLFLSKSNPTTVDIAAGDVTAMTMANPPVVSVTDVTGVNAGDVVKLSATDIAEVDNKLFVVGAVNTTANTFELKGIDLSGNTGTFNAATAKAEVMTVVNSFQALCLSAIAVNVDTPTSISVGTYCDPTATIPGSSTSAGTLDLTAYHDPSDAGWKLLIDAEESGDQHTLLIQFPGNQGELVATGVISAMQISDIPLDGATTWSAQMTLSSKPRMIF